MLEQGVADEAGVVLHVLHQHAQQIVHLAGHGRTLHHFGPGLHRGTEQVARVAQRVVGLLLQPHIQVGRQAQPDTLGRYQGHIGRNHAGLLQPAHPAQHGRGRQAGLTGQRVIGDPAVLLQRAQDAAVDGIELDRGFHALHFAVFLRIECTARRTMHETCANRAAEFWVSSPCCWRPSWPSSPPGTTRWAPTGSSSSNSPPPTRPPSARCSRRWASRPSPSTATSM
mmetsp:Transcript_17030/g.40614  ORF Transcript_17030/g.40614 Transcript_17030/m.40614 type:complete len:226 (-) Transcript_17030:1482-2159(-)